MIRPTHFRPTYFRFSFKATRLLLALFATSSLYAGFSGAAFAETRSNDDVEPTIEINMDALDMLNRQEFPASAAYVHGWNKGPEGQIIEKQKPAHKAKAKKPKHAKAKAPKVAPVAAEEPQKPSKKERLAAEKAEKERKAAEVKAAKEAEKIVAEQEAADAKAAKEAAKMPEPPAPSVDDKAIKQATAPIPELNPIAPPAPPVVPDVPMPELPAPPVIATPPAGDLSITAMPPAPSPAGDFASGLSTTSKAEPEPIVKAPDGVAPPVALIPQPAPEAKDGLPAISTLLGSKPATPTSAPAATDEKLPSPQALMDKLDLLDAKKDATKAQDAGADKSVDKSQPPTLRVVFLSTETSVPLSVKPDLDKLVKRLKDGNERVTLIAYASGIGDQATTARRVSLSRALSVRAYLIDQGVGNLRINVQAEGNKDAGAEPDRVDIFISAK